MLYHQCQKHSPSLPAKNLLPRPLSPSHSPLSSSFSIRPVRRIGVFGCWCFKILFLYSLCTQYGTWQPWNQELYGAPTEPVRCPSKESLIISFLKSPYPPLSPEATCSHFLFFFWTSVQLLSWKSPFLKYSLAYEILCSKVPSFLRGWRAFSVSLAGSSSRKGWCSYRLNPSHDTPGLEWFIEQWGRLVFEGLVEFSCETIWAWWFFRDIS